MRLSLWSVIRRASASLLLALTVLSCAQYEYNSPDPGVIDIRLKSVNTRTDLLPFFTVDTTTGDISGTSMTFTLKTLEAFQANDVKEIVFSDLQAIRRNPDGDEFDALSLAARDSLLILGQTYAPPETFVRVELRIEAPQFVFRSYGFYGSLIPVSLVLPFNALQKLEADIPVQSGRTTRVTVTFDLDESLIQLTETFLFLPTFYISSVEVL